MDFVHAPEQPDYVMINSNVADAVKIIYGGCFGIAIIRRSKDDNHLCMRWLVEDDETWHLMGDHSVADTFWIPDMVRVLSETQEWLDKNAVCGEWGYCLED